MINPSTTRFLKFPLGANLALVAVLMPLAFLLHGSLGVKTVLIGCTVSVAIVLLTFAMQALNPCLATEPMKQFALVGSFRLILSLTALLLACVSVRESPQPEILLYCVPLYFGLLWSESVVQIQQNRSPILK